MRVSFRNVIHDRVLISAMGLMMTAVSLDAQVKPLVEVGAGLSFSTNNGYYEPLYGLGLSVSAGLEYQINDIWGISPTVGHINMLNVTGDLPLPKTGGGEPDVFSMFDCSVLAQYRYDVDGREYIFGFGPAFYVIDKDERYRRLDTDFPQAGLIKNNKTDLGLRISVTRDVGKNRYRGFKVNAGLRNMMKQYPEIDVTGQKHLFSVLFVTGFKF